jgi:predicted kinase
LDAGLYAPAETDRTYAEVVRLTRTIVAAGYPVVVDGTFLQRHQRTRFRALASELNVPFVIVDFAAAVETLRARVQQRHETGHDASEADVHVLEHQLQVAEPITSDERAVTVRYDAEAPLEESRHAGAWRPVLERLHLDAPVAH